jgi:DNA-binding NarL/FixJ family response regulator
MDRTCHVLIADDHTLVAQSIQRLLQDDFPGADIVSDAQELLQAAATSQPDVVLMDIGMPLLNGIEATRHLRKISPATKIIILTMHNQPEYVAEAVRAGASGYVLKSCALSELTIAIRQALKGYVYLTPSVREHEVSADLNSHTHTVHRSLTSRQREVLQLVAEGCTAKEIAIALKLSIKTAVYHKTAIMDKLGIRTTAALTRYALEHGVMPRALGRELVSPLPILEARVDQDSCNPLARSAG